MIRRPTCSGAVLASDPQGGLYGSHCGPTHRLRSDSDVQGHTAGTSAAAWQSESRVAAGWNAIRMLAEQSGITAKGTRRDQAGAIARQLGTDDQALIQLGREADYATFSGQDIESGQATTYWTGVDQLRKAMLASLPRFRRIRTRLSLKSVAILSNGHAAKPHTTHCQAHA